MQQWICNYESIGKNTFQIQENRRYSKKLKLLAVQDYLTRYDSQDAICIKYSIRSKHKLQKWIMKYNVQKNYISHNCNYAETAKNFNVSYQHARNYTVKYEINRF